MRSDRNHAEVPEGENLEFMFPVTRDRPKAKKVRPPVSQPSLRVAALFAGIGGIELGMSRAGHETILLNEIDASAGTVLRARFQGIPLHEDVTTLERLPAGTDLVTAGFPCQDLSQACLLYTSPSPRD